MNTMIIGEVGTCWESLDDILQSCEILARFGSVPKLQLWRVDKVVNKDKAPKMYEVMEKYQLPHEWVRRINHAFPQTCYSVFDKESINFLEAEVNPMWYKIASGDCDNYPLIEHALDTGKQVFISTGGGKPEGIAKEATYLHCISAYPAPSAYLGNLKDPLYEGYSDHTTSILVPALAVAKGAKYVEKHFKLNDHVQSPDAPHSLNLHAWGKMVEMVREAEGHMGWANQPMECEMANHKLGRRGLDGLRPRDVA